MSTSGKEDDSESTMEEGEEISSHSNMKMEDFMENMTRQMAILSASISGMKSSIRETGGSC